MIIHATTCWIFAVGAETCTCGANPKKLVTLSDKAKFSQETNSKSKARAERKVEDSPVI